LVRLDFSEMRGAFLSFLVFFYFFTNSSNFHNFSNLKKPQVNIKISMKKRGHLS
jgi:hypothetical protein